MEKIDIKMQILRTEDLQLTLFVYQGVKLWFCVPRV